MLISIDGTLGWENACHQDHTHLQVVDLRIRSHHEALTDRASLWLINGARRWLTQGACSSLPLVLMGGECLLPGPRTCKWLAFASEAAMKL